MNSDYSPSSSTNVFKNSRAGAIALWYVGGEDIHFRIPLLLALREKGFNVGAVGSGPSDAFAQHHIPYFQYFLERRMNPVADIQTYNQLWQLFNQYKPDIVHGFDTKPALIAPIVAMKANIPGRVRTITGMGYVFSSNSPVALALRPLYRYLQRKASTATSITVFQNPDDRQYFYKHQMVQPERDALVLGSGIDIEQLMQRRPVPEALAAIRQELKLEGKLVVIMVARLVVSKGVREFLQAASIVCNTEKNIKFLLVGPLASEGRQAVSIAEIRRRADVVSYLGIRNDIPVLLALSDLFVLPSYYREGIPRVLLEAGAMGLPIITTDMPGCKEVVQNGWNGLLVQPGDANALAAAILKLLKSQDNRLLMGDRSKLFVRETFSLTKVANAYADIYYRALGLQDSRLVSQI